MVREVDAGEGVGAEVVITGSCSDLASASLSIYIHLVFPFLLVEKSCEESGKSALTMCVLVLIMASVAGVVLRALLLVVAAAAAKHLVKEAKLGVGEGEER